MITHNINLFFKSIHRNRFFYSINLIGFITGFLLLTMIFTYVYQELSFDSFHKNGSSIYRIHSGGYGVTPLCFGEKLKDKVPEIDGIARFSPAFFTFSSNNKEISPGKTFYTDPEIFQLFSFKLLSGNAATVLEAPFSIVIDQSTARILFGEKSPIGETIKNKEGTIFTITGVMEDIPYNSHIQSSAFISIETLRQTGDKTIFNCGSWFNLTYVSLTAKANTIETEKKINSLLEDSRMGTSEGKIPLQLQPLRKIYFDYDQNKFDGSQHGNRQTVLMYLAISILLLLIVMINYINLSTAISQNRIKEIAIHRVNGANQSHIINQMIIESVGVVLISFTITLLIIEWLMPQLSALLNIPVSNSLNRSKLYLCYVAVIVIIGLITGFVPGLFLSKINTVKALKNESVFNSRGIHRKNLMLFQLIIVAVLLNSTFIINKQLQFVLRQDLGFNYENVISFSMDKVLQCNNELLRNNLLKDPSILSVSFSSAAICDGFSKASMGIDNETKFCNFHIIDPWYLDLFQIKLKKGRNFSTELKTDDDRSCLVNEEFCKVFGDENPVGKVMNNKKVIIGVVKDFNFTSLHKKIEPLVLMESDSGLVVQIKIMSVNSAETIKFIRKSCLEISPCFETNCSFIEKRIKNLYKSEFDMKNSFEVYAFITFVIALLGLFGLTLFMARKKTREVSIRKLNGATLNDTFIFFIKDQLKIIVLANLIAIPVSFLIMNRWLGNFQYRTGIGIFVFIKTLLLTIVLTLISMAVIIIRTHKTNLIETLKPE